jgi:protein-tyrosine phosphatase
VPPGHCNYINASPIVLRSADGSKETKYIATQGPKEGLVSHLWRMIWEETSDPAVVVMLTQMYETGREKCFQYFPEDDSSPDLSFSDDDEFGDDFSATITLLEKRHDDAARTTVRKLQMTVGDATKVVWHLQFTGWPDFMVPTGPDKAALLQLIALSNELHTVKESPRIVHCSAGVGRTGSFITLDHLLAEIKADTILADEKEDIIFDTVDNLRRQRMSMVQSEMQLLFIYQVVREQWESAHNVEAADEDADASDTGEPMPKIAKLAAAANAEMAENVARDENGG